MSDIAAPAAAPSAAPSNTPDASPKAPTAPQSAPKSNTAAPDTKMVGKDSEPKAPDTAEKEARKEAERRKYKLKVDGQDEEVELTDEEISVRLQKERAAAKRMQESAELKKKFAQAVDLIKKDPFAALKDPAFGIDLEALAEQRLLEKYKLELMPEEQRKQMEMERKLKEYETKEQERTRLEQEAHQRTQQEQFEAKIFQETEKTFMAALESADLPKDYETLYMMADVAKLNLDYGVELTPQQLAAEVRAKLDGYSKREKSLRANLKGDKLLEYLGTDTVKEVLQASVAKLKGGAAKLFEPTKPIPQDIDDDKPARQMRTPSQWRKEIGLK
jgi:hypothetical protein